MTNNTFDESVLSVDNRHSCLASSMCGFSNGGKSAEHLATFEYAASDCIKELFF